MKIDIVYNELTASDFGVMVKQYPELPVPEERITIITIPGRDGNLIKKSGVYEEKELAITFNYIGNDWNTVWNDVKTWLSVTDSELILSDDSTYYRKISRVILQNVIRKSPRIIEFTAIFILKDGLRYAISGKNEYTINEVKYNYGIVAHPIYKITGNGVCTLEVNGKKAVINVSGNVIIDTDLMIAYKADGTSQNTAINCEYSELYLKPQNNSIVIASGFGCAIIPNWRYL